MCNRKGELPPLLVMYSYKQLPKLISSTFPKSWAIGRSGNGWMTQERFAEYVANIFHPWLPKRIESGFKTCGFWPFDPENIKFE